MKVQELPSRQGVEFTSLRGGDLFRYTLDGEICMVLEQGVTVSICSGKIVHSPTTGGWSFYVYPVGGQFVEAPTEDK